VGMDSPVGLLLQPVGFLLFLVAAIAETKRVPFDLPEGESEIIGYFVEYSGMRFGLFMMTDFIETILISALITNALLRRLAGSLPALRGGFQWIYLSMGRRLGHFSLCSRGVAGAGLCGQGLFLLLFCLLVRWTLPRFSI